MSDARILVVGDEQCVLDLVSAHLRQERYEVYTVTTGPSGLKAACAFKPDLIVLHASLPRGWRQIRSSRVRAR
jgi:DNA-binding response OmpR family regulator